MHSGVRHPPGSCGCPAMPPHASMQGSFPHVAGEMCPALRASRQSSRSPEVTADEFHLAAIHGHDRGPPAPAALAHSRSGPQCSPVPGWCCQQTGSGTRHLSQQPPWPRVEFTLDCRQSATSTGRGGDFKPGHAMLGRPGPGGVWGGLQRCLRCSSGNHRQVRC